MNNASSFSSPLNPLVFDGDAGHRSTSFLSQSFGIYSSGKTVFVSKRDIFEERFSHSGRFIWFFWRVDKSGPIVLNNSRYLVPKWVPLFGLGKCYISCLSHLLFDPHGWADFSISNIRSKCYIVRIAKY